MTMTDPVGGPRLGWRRDDGVALLTVLLMMTALTALLTTVSVVATNNLQNSSRDRQAGGAAALADGGIAEAVNYLKTVQGAAGTLTCALAVPATCSTDWASPTSPHLVQTSGGRQYLVYFELLSAGNNNDHTRLYRVHSQGYAGSGPGARQVTVDLQYTPSSSFPVGIFTRQYDAGGTGNITNESVFSDGCINQRNHLKMTGIDPYYHIPAAAHSSGLITASNGACSPSDSGNIHSATAPCNNQPVSGSNVDLRGDQDARGADLTTLSPAPACLNYAIGNIQMRVVARAHFRHRQRIASRGRRDLCARHISKQY